MMTRATSSIPTTPPTLGASQRRGRPAALAVLLALLVLFPIGGCDIGPSRPVVVRFWNGFTGPDGRTMLALVKRFNRENPDVQVLMQRMDWATYYNKLFVAGIGGRAPEMFIVHAANIARFMQADFVRPVDDLVRGPKGIAESDFSENVWKAVENGGRHYGVPLDVHILGMYYNKKLFREAGIVDERGEPKPPATREEFLSALEKITALPSPDEAHKRWGYVFTWYRTNLYTFLCQFGGKVFTDDKSRCTLNSPANVEALQFCVDLIRKYRVVPPPENFDNWIGFRQGRVGITFEGIYMLSDLQKQTDLDWGAAPLPTLGSERAAWADSHTMCLKRDLEGERLQATWRFVRFLSDHSLDWAEGGQIPVRKSLRDTDRFRSMYAQFEFSRQIPYIRYLPQVPFIFEFEGEFDIAVEKALRGSISPKEAFDSATTIVNEILERRRAMLEQARGRAGAKSAHDTEGGDPIP